MTGHNPLRIGMLGTARIARQFASGVAPSTEVRVVGIASRDKVKADAFAAELNIPRAFSSYDELLAAADIDAVYIPLPNTMHAEWTIKAAEAGKHVLCEKPLAMSLTEAKAMFDAARRNGVQLVEAYPYLSQPTTLKARELIRSGGIGRPQLISANFGVSFSDPADIRFQPDLGGGSMLDAGSYCVSFARVMAGERPKRVQALARWTETGVDRTMVATIEFPSGLIAQVASTYATHYYRHGQIAGEKGIVDTHFLNHPPAGGPPAIHVRRGAMPGESEVETILADGGNGFRFTAESFARLVAGNADGWNGATQEESLDIAATLSALVESARTGAPVDVEA
ncbi:MAG: xylose dehydrogenase (NAD/NADP) [Alphaproteobacteria bacterium]|jgi:xylose dehydrogenase (NAD/NADP)